MPLMRYEDPEGGVHVARRDGSGRWERLCGDPLGAAATPWEPSGQEAQVARPLAPVQATAIFCIGLNYRRHAAETGAALPEWPVLFMKSPGAVQDPGGPIVLPRALASGQVDYEGELAVVIGRRCRNVSRDEALGAVLGFTCGNDVSARDWQKQWGGGQWCRGKTFDTFAPLGPVLVPPDELEDPCHLGLRTTVNGEIVQDGETGDMIFDVPSLISFLSGSTTLLPGTVIFTGTPEGVGMAAHPPRWLRPGDVVSVEIDGIGVLTNPVAEEIP
ncbi:MAG: fumarylacetoacetate hydrolase family protein [Cyanobacteriota bacterium]|jgi:2-keto-4-pentenoate hydratase/2-oxohepta-3-ene-1,7-dioic acid hydratase in catechol pathway|nr:fumarylacetoacetate hydrolase family protein [Cyanobacteriota bacterium]